MLRFAGFELDPQRSELRGPDGETIKLRPKAFDLLLLLAANPGRVVSKHELMAAVWPNVHVGEDNLFQCIREIRGALGDDSRQLIKAVSGRGYLLEAEVSGPADPGVLDRQAPAGAPAAVSLAEMPGELRRAGFEMTPRRIVLAALAGLGVSALTVAAMRLPGLVAAAPWTIAVVPITAAEDDPPVVQMATGVSRELADGLAGIESLRVVVPSGVVPAADLVVTGELERSGAAWRLRARMTRPASGVVHWTTSLSVDSTEGDMPLQRTRLTAGLGHDLTRRINALVNSAGRSGDDAPAGRDKVAIEQAMASINQTTPERFRTAQAMLEQALADDADNVDLQVAFAALQLRGIQMTWFPQAEREATENDIGAIMTRALRAQPDYIPVLETQCRFLVTTNRFGEGLVACGKVLARDPWDGAALYLIGLSQVFLGRFEDALATFKQAERYDTPQVARWTWAIGAGWACMLLGRAEDAVPWLHRSIAITPASGRTHLLLAATYQQLGRIDEARAALAKGLELRPGSTARNVPPPNRNASPVYREAAGRIMGLMVAAGLPEN